MAPTAVTVKPTLAERHHLEGCPANRIESYPASKPHRVEDGNGNAIVTTRTVTVVRCVTCGGQRVDDPLKAATSQSETAPTE